MQRYEATGQRLTGGFAYQVGSWLVPRFVVVKAEATAHGTSRRFMVTNHPGAAVLPEAAYAAYAQRGESENRNGPERRCWFNRRREQDPLGEGHPHTWRTRPIKVAAVVTVSTRRIVIRLSGVWPHLAHYIAVCDAVTRRPWWWAEDTS